MHRRYPHERGQAGPLSTWLRGESGAEGFLVQAALGGLKHTWLRGGSGL